MRWLDSMAYQLSRAAACLAAAIMLFVVCHIMLEIALRVFFSTSTFVLDEFVGYGVAAMTFLALGYALEEGALIRVSVVISRLGAGGVRRAVELFCIGSTFLLMTFISWYFWKSAVRNWERGAVSETVAEVPLWIPEGLVLVGMVIFSLQLLNNFVRVLLGGALPVSSALENKEQTAER